MFAAILFKEHIKWSKNLVFAFAFNQCKRQGSHSTWKNLEKLRVHLENLEIWNFEKFNKNHGKMTWNLEKLGGY